jgi:hypothetical protein
MPLHRPPAILAYLVSLALFGAPVEAQTTLDRTTNLDAGWTAYPGLAYLNLPYRVVGRTGERSELVGTPTFELAMGLPAGLLLGGRFTPQSPIVAARPDEWELFGRFAPLSEMAGDGFDLAATVGVNGAARSLDAEIAAARWLGAGRLVGVVRGMSDGYGAGDARLALAAGAVVHPLPRRAPIALTADMASLVDRRVDERFAWSVGASLGLTYTNHTLGVFATNTATGTLQGRSRGEPRVRYGVEFTVPIPVGRFLGWYASREDGLESVVVEPPQPPDTRAAAIHYLFLPMRIEVAAGTTIEWINADEVVHTVAADDGSWNSGAIDPGATWSARFDRPGRYTFHCGPHPFMQGVVVVR